MQVREIMRPSKMGIEAHASLVQAAREMDRQGVGWLPVFSDGRVIGTVTERDIVIGGISKARNPVSTAVSKVMSGEVIHCFEDDDITRAAEVMGESRCTSLLVLDAEGWMSGFLTLEDLAGTERADLTEGVLANLARNGNRK